MRDSFIATKPQRAQMHLEKGREDDDDDEVDDDYYYYYYY